jgi:cytochrome P450
MRSLVTYHDAREGFRRRELRQALYDAGHRLMTGVIVNLHGDEHIARRRLEQRLFRRDVFAWYERERIPAIIDAVLAPATREGRGDLLPLARRTMMTLSVDVAGVDLPRRADGELDPDVFAEFERIMHRLARASTVAHATGDTIAIVADGDDALARFDVEFFQPARARRADLLARFERGELDEEQLPRDVLTTLLRNQDRLELPAATVLREVAYFPWVGSHSTSGQLVHAMHHVFEWLAHTPGDRQRLADDEEVLQRFVHESMRLHPASPVALRIATEEVTLRSGVTIEAGEEVRVEVELANRDPSVFGEHADAFDPFRPLPDEVARWGLSFGHGGHACLGRELAGGLEPDGSSELHLAGAVTLMAQRMLAAGARPDPDDPPSADPTTTRAMWGRYPVRFGP